MSNESTKISDMERILEEELKASLVGGKLPCAESAIVLSTTSVVWV